MWSRSAEKIPAASLVHSLFFGLFLCAFAIRALIPPGYMPGSVNGDFITICTGHGTVSIPTDQDANPDQDDRSTLHNQVCSFAVGGIALLPTFGELGFASLESRPASFIDVALPIDWPRTEPPLGARGPPPIS